jgi:hypothetical protein
VDSVIEISATSVVLWGAPTDIERLSSGASHYEVTRRTWWLCTVVRHSFRRLVGRAGVPHSLHVPEVASLALTLWCSHLVVLCVCRAKATDTLWGRGSSVSSLWTGDAAFSILSPHSLVPGVTPAATSSPPVPVLVANHGHIIGDDWRRIRHALCHDCHVSIHRSCSVREDDKTLLFPRALVAVDLHLSYLNTRTVVSNGQVDPFNVGRDINVFHEALSDC